MNTLQTQDWYTALVNECQAILVERFYNSNLEAITAYGEVGERIVEDDNYKKNGKGNKQFNIKLFQDIKIGERTGYYCLQFYERKLQEPIKQNKYKDVCTAVQSICTKYPLIENGIIYFPLERMYKIAILDTSKVLELRKLNTRNYKYLGDRDFNGKGRNSEKFAS